MKKFVANVEWLWGTKQKKVFDTEQERTLWCNSMIEDYRRVQLSREIPLDPFYLRTDMTEYEWDIYL